MLEVPSSNGSPAIDARGLTKRFGDLTAVRGLDLTGRDALLLPDPAPIHGVGIRGPGLLLRTGLGRRQRAAAREQGRKNDQDADGTSRGMSGHLVRSLP